MNAAAAATDTKTKILRTAAELFAKKGFEGTSVRDIASAADVNISAINYHFKSKDSLYWAVSLDAHEWLEAGIRDFAKDNKTTYDLAWKIFDFLHNNSSALKNAFVMMISDSAPPMDEQAQESFAHRKDFGPPGGQYLFAAIQQEVGADVPPQAITWAVKNVFTYIFHWNLMLGSNYCRGLFEDHPDFQIENIQRTLKHNINAILDYVRANHAAFQ